MGNFCCKRVWIVRLECSFRAIYKLFTILIISKAGFFLIGLNIAIQQIHGWACVNKSNISGYMYEREVVLQGFTHCLLYPKIIHVIKNTLVQRMLMWS